MRYKQNINKSFNKIIIVIAMIVGPNALAQSPALKIGDAAPNLTGLQLLQPTGKTPADLNSLKGKVIVLEFWAIWCSPCMPAITHLNGLAEKFKNRSIQFISITNALEASFCLNIQKVKQEMDVMTLSVAEGKAGILRPSKSESDSSSWGKGRLQGQKQPIATLAEFLSSIFNMPVVDETLLKEKYDWDLPYNRTVTEILDTALLDQLGLKLTKTKKMMDKLVVDKADSTNCKQ